MLPRAVAISVLARVRATDAYLNLVLDSQLSEQALSDPRDSGLVTELCYGATRRQLALDHAIQQFADRRLEQIEDRVLAALRIGVYQLFYSRVPKHAAVGETVQALKTLQLERAAGFVNALLRKVAALPEPPLPPKTDLVQHLSIRESHPEWLVRRWMRQFGAEQAEQMLVHDNLPPPVVLRTNTAKISREALLAQLAEAGIEAKPTTLSPVGLWLPAGGKLDDLYGYAEGLWQVQDEAAQLVGLYADMPADIRVLDVCAAPGGKACHLAETHKVVALDLHPNKLPKISAEATRLGLREKMALIAHDATRPLPKALGDFDGILVDAPCSGLGTLRRHPELRYRRLEADLGRLAALQRNILETSQDRVKPGGLLVYAVCSTDPQEGQDQIEMFLRSHPEFTAEAPSLPAEPKLPLWQGYLRTLPGPEQLDGFFSARLRRTY